MQSWHDLRALTSVAFPGPGAGAFSSALQLSLATSMEEGGMGFLAGMNQHLPAIRRGQKKKYSNKHILLVVTLTFKYIPTVQIIRQTGTFTPGIRSPKLRLLLGCG